MIRFVVMFFGLLAFNSLCAQPAALEVLAGEQNYFYQHTLSKSIGSSRFGFFHTSSLHAFYDNDDLNELMSQSYITYSLTGFARIAVGTFYATKPGITPAVSLQFAYAHHNFKASLVPRIDLKKNGSVEMMILLEYRPLINDRMKFYSRAQFMTNYGPYHHNRSYQNFRAGLQIEQTIVGIALNIDERGSEINTLHNVGIFLRYEFN